MAEGEAVRGHVARRVETERKIWSVKGGDEEIRRERYTLTYELDCGWVPYLEGLADAAVPGARELAQAVVDHERVTVWVGEVG